MPSRKLAACLAQDSWSRALFALAIGVGCVDVEQARPSCKKVPHAKADCNTPPDCVEEMCSAALPVTTCTCAGVMQRGGPGCGPVSNWKMDWISYVLEGFQCSGGANDFPKFHKVVVRLQSPHQLSSLRAHQTMPEHWFTGPHTGFDAVKEWDTSWRAPEPSGTDLQLVEFHLKFSHVLCSDDPLTYCIYADANNDHTCQADEPRGVASLPNPRDIREPIVYTTAPVQLGLDSTCCVYPGK